MYGAKDIKIYKTFHIQTQNLETVYNIHTYIYMYISISHIRNKGLRLILNLILIENEMKLFSFI